MFDMSWGEIMVIGGVALIVIGPKDLPKALRTVGQMTTKVRRMASEFQSQFTEAMREAELEDVRKEVEGLNRDVASATASSFNPLQTIRDEIRGAVETKPAYGASTASTAGPDARLLPVEEVGPDHHVQSIPGEVAPGPEPAGTTAHPALDGNPDVQPLVPLPFEASSHAAEAPVLETGPGLETSIAEMPPPAVPTPPPGPGHPPAATPVPHPSEKSIDA